MTKVKVMKDLGSEYLKSLTQSEYKQHNSNIGPYHGRKVEKKTGTQLQGPNPGSLLYPMGPRLSPPT